MSSRISRRSVLARCMPKRRAVSRAFRGDAVATPRSRKPRAFLRTGSCTAFTKLPAPQSATPISRAGPVSVSNSPVGAVAAAGRIAPPAVSGVADAAGASSVA